MKKSPPLEIGSNFGYWKVLGPDPDTNSYSICLCTACNQTTKSIRNYDLKTNISRSCCKANENRRKTALQKWGAESYSQTQECKDKVAKTNTNRYGDSNYNKTKEGKQKYKKTCLEKYGVDNYRKSNECKNKLKEVSLEKYGVENYTQTKEYKTKAKQTNLEKYGEDHYSKTPEFKERIKKTSLENYGVEHPRQSEEVQEKARKSNLEKYGVEYYSKTEQFKIKSKETCLLKYGVENASKSSIIKDKARSTNIRLGNLTPLSSGLSVKQTCEAYNVPITSGCEIYKKHGEKVLLEYIKNYNENIYSTELAIINLLNVPFPNLSKYNKEPQEFKINRKPDFRLEKDNKILYLNIDGLYYHSEASRNLDKSYHLSLRQDFESNNHKIVQFRSNELQKPLIIKSIIESYFGLSQKIYARKCTIKEVPTNIAKEFFNLNHLMGHLHSPTFGLYREEELVCAISIKKKEDGLDVVRFCNKIDMQVVGGLSKLLKHIENTYKPSFIQSFVDLRYATGHSYLKIGFELQGTSLGWSWTDGINVFNRLKCRANMDDRQLSQEEHAKELKWYKIYDAGQAKYIKKY